MSSTPCASHEAIERLYEAGRPVAEIAREMTACVKTGTKATLAARMLLAASPVSMRRKRALLVEIAGRNVEAPLCLQS